MNITSILSRIARTAVVTAVAAGLYAGVAVMPASAAPAPAVAPAPAAAAAAGASLVFDAACGPTSATIVFGMREDNLAGYTYAVRFGAYRYGDNGWQWVGTLSGFQYKTVLRSTDYVIAGGENLRTVRLPSYGFYVVYAEVYVWTGAAWSQAIVKYANHYQARTGRPIQTDTWCGAFTNV